MLRFLAQIFGLFILAAGFAALVVDGTRSIAGSALTLTPFSILFASKMAAIRDAILGHAPPLVWDPVAVWLFRLPIWAVLAAAGLFLLWAARRRAREVGYSTRS